jgi:hypothetical protein
MLFGITMGRDENIGSFLMRMAMYVVVALFLFRKSTHICLVCACKQKSLPPPCSNLSSTFTPFPFVCSQQSLAHIHVTFFSLFFVFFLVYLQQFRPQRDNRFDWRDHRVRLLPLGNGDALPSVIVLRPCFFFRRPFSRAVRCSTLHIRHLRHDCWGWLLCGSRGSPGPDRGWPAAPHSTPSCRIQSTLRVMDR